IAENRLLADSDRAVVTDKLVVEGREPTLLTGLALLRVLVSVYLHLTVPKTLAIKSKDAPDWRWH
ncbi:MAG: hypothetical protein LBJ48_04195, partial [Coriobacteriales bacterium]|nr:hypothetical protein [Coriobacteriales bacterium]